MLAPELAALPGSSVPHLGQRVISSPSQDHLKTRKDPKFTTDVRNVLSQLGQGVRIRLSCHGAMASFSQRILAGCDKLRQATPHARAE